MLNSTSVKVEWRLVPEKYRRGIITKYVISYKAEEETGKTEEPASVEETVVNGLRQSTTYSFSVWAETVKGAGPKSLPKNVTTLGKEIKIIKYLFSYDRLVFVIPLNLCNVSCLFSLVILFMLDPICCSFLSWFGHDFSATQFFVYPQSPYRNIDMIFWIFPVVLCHAFCM